MFTLIIPYTAKRKPKRRIYPTFKAYKDIDYFELQIPMLSGKVDWRGLKIQNRLMLPKGMTAPKELKALGSDEWKTRLSFEFLREKLKAEKCDCVIYDKKGSFSPKISEILPFARAVSVFTDAIDIYEEIAELSLSQFGCAPKINTRAGLRQGYCFTSENNACISDMNFKIISKNNICEEMIKIPPEYIGIGIKNLSNIAFSEALCICFKKGTPRDFLRF